MAEQNTTNTEWPVCPYCGDVKGIYTRRRKGHHARKEKEQYKNMYCIGESRNCGHWYRLFVETNGMYTTRKLDETETKGDEPGAIDV
jgi:hypothetical protein